MGQSTDAILFYGYCWDEEMQAPWDPEGNDDSEETWERRYTRLSGHTEPAAPYPNDSDKSDAAEAIRAAYSKYWDVERQIAGRSGVEVWSHCSGECPMPYVAVKKSRIKASRGTPECVGALDVDPEWDRMLREFCGLMGIKPPACQKPRWWLVSYWS